MALLVGILWCAAIGTVLIRTDDLAADAAISAAFALFVAFGLWLVTAPFREYWRAKRTVYGVTSEHAIISNGLILPTLKRIAPSDIGAIEVAPFLFGTSKVSFTTQDVLDGKANKTQDGTGSLLALIEIALWLFGASPVSLTSENPRGRGGKIGFFALADAKGAAEALIVLKGGEQHS